MRYLLASPFGLMGSEQTAYLVNISMHGETDLERLNAQLNLTICWCAFIDRKSDSNRALNYKNASKNRIADLLTLPSMVTSLIFCVNRLKTVY